MTIPVVTEIPPVLEPVSADPFLGVRPLAPVPTETVRRRIVD